MRNFRDLVVWRRSHDLTLKIYEVSEQFPRKEMFGITSQLRRAGASIPTNLAEACGRRSDNDFGRFVRIAMGSASEVDYLILLMQEEADFLSAELNAIRKMLTVLDKRVHQSAHEPAGRTS